MLISHRNNSLSALAKRADLLPNTMVIIPFGATQKMPTYTPIGLTEFSGNTFSRSPSSHLMRAEQKIKIDTSMSHAKRSFAAEVMLSFCQNMLPEMLKTNLKLCTENKLHPIQLLSLLPVSRPERWFGSTLLNNLNSSIESSWEEYKKSVLETPLFFDENSGEYKRADQIVRIEVEDETMSELLYQLLDKFGVAALSKEEENYLGKLHPEDWRFSNPLDEMITIENPHNLRDFLENHIDKMRLETLGEELVRKLILALCINPQGLWESEDSKVIPIIPDSDGKLWPLRSPDGQSHFYSASDKYPDLLPSNRTLHNDFVELCSAIEFSLHHLQCWLN